MNLYNVILIGSGQSMLIMPTNTLNGGEELAIYPGQNIFVQMQPAVGRTPIYQ